MLRVKGSGSDLKSVQRKDFPGVRMDDILALLPREDMGDQEMVSYLAHGLLDPGGVRPSIETLLHGFVNAPAVVHTHADAIVSLTNNENARETLADVFGGDVIALDYRRPGFGISRDVAERDREASRGEGAAARQARHDLLGRHRQGRVRGDDRAHHARRGSHRGAPPLAQRLHRRRASAARAGGAPRDGDRLWRRAYAAGWPRTSA